MYGYCDNFLMLWISFVVHFIEYSNRLTEKKRTKIFSQVHYLILEFL